jgi:hypothetical protein
MIVQGHKSAYPPPQRDALTNVLYRLFFSEEIQSNNNLASTI